MNPSAALWPGNESKLVGSRGFGAHGPGGGDGDAAPPDPISISIPSASPAQFRATSEVLQGWLCALGHPRICPSSSCFSPSASLAEDIPNPLPWVTSPPGSLGRGSSCTSRATGTFGSSFRELSHHGRVRRCVGSDGRGSEAQTWRWQRSSPTVRVPPVSHAALGCLHASLI